VGSLRKNDAKLFGQEFADEAYNKTAISKALLYLISSTSHVYCELNRYAEKPTNQPPFYPASPSKKFISTITSLVDKIL